MVHLKFHFSTSGIENRTGKVDPAESPSLLHPPIHPSIHPSIHVASNPSWGHSDGMKKDLFPYSVSLFSKIHAQLRGMDLSGKQGDLTDLESPSMQIDNFAPSLQQMERNETWEHLGCVTIQVSRLDFRLPSFTP